MKSLAVLHASQLVTVAGPKRPRIGRELSELAIITDGGMLIRDGRIELVGSSNEIEKKAGDAEVINARGKVVLPGFVDAHTHLVFAGNRLDDFERRARGDTYERIAKAGGGIWSTVEKTRAASEADLLAQAQRHADWFLRCGTTIVESKSGYGLTLEDELKILRVMRRLNQKTPLEIVPTFLGAHAIPREMHADEYVHLVVNEVLPRVTSDSLAEFCDVFCERGYFDIEQSRRILNVAKKLGLKLRVHADQLSNSGAAQLAAELKAATADHLENTDEQGIAALRFEGVQPVLLPGSVYALGSTCYPRARDMIEAGLAVVIATDFNPGSSPTTSMPMILSLACTQMKMSSAEAISASTINPAYSLTNRDFKPHKVRKNHQTGSNRFSYSDALRRNWHEWHNRDWWRQHCNSLVFVTGGYYFLDASYWYPAYGYDPFNSYYDYDGPIYTYGNLLPDQVIGNVQAALQDAGYYFGAVTGSLSVETRAALVNFQRDQGLIVTGAIDEPTVAALGLY